MSVKFRVKFLKEGDGRVEAIFFPDDVERNDDGSPKWFAGPIGYDLTTDANGVPLDGRAAVQWISDRFDETVITRMRRLRNATPESKAMPILRAAVDAGTEFLVEKSPLPSTVASTEPAVL